MMFAQIRSGGVVIWNTIEHDLLDAAELHARAGLLFGYARLRLAERERDCVGS
jgi:hypothetical protein